MTDITDAPVGRRAEAREARHESFVEHILEMFDDPANRGLTMDDIATRLGINKVILYRYFGSRDGMFEQLGMRWLERALTDFESAMARNDFGERLFGGMVSYLTTVRTHAASYRVIADHSGPGVAHFVNVASDFIADVMLKYSPSLEHDAMRRRVWANSIAGAVFRVGDVVERDRTLDLTEAALQMAALFQPGIHLQLANDADLGALASAAPN